MAHACEAGAFLVILKKLIHLPLLQIDTCQLNKVRNKNNLILLINDFIITKKLCVLYANLESLSWMIFFFFLAKFELLGVGGVARLGVDYGDAYWTRCKVFE